VVAKATPIATKTLPAIPRPSTPELFRPPCRGDRPRTHRLPAGEMPGGWRAALGAGVQISFICMLAEKPFLPLQLDIPVLSLQ